MKVTERKWTRPIMEENSILILVALRNFLLGLELLHYESTWCIYCTSSILVQSTKRHETRGMFKVSYSTGRARWVCAFDRN